MKILVFGSSGQLGSIFLESVPKKFEVIAPLRNEADLTIEDEIQKCICYYKPNVILNFAAFTDVDGSEKNPKLAFQINSIAPSIISSCANKINSVFLHISTDYVYNTLNNKFLNEESDINPINVYGKSKALGEKFIKENCQKFIILRTSWLYSNYKNNFFTTISKLIKTKNSIEVVNDQIGSPTLVNDFIGGLLIILECLNKNNLGNIVNKKIWGIYNLSNSGVTSWYKFACKIAFKMGYNPSKKIIPVNSIDYGSVAHRPLNSRLDNSKILKTFGIELPFWEDSFNDFYENSI